MTEEKKRITLISGASRGIGRAVAIRLARENHAVMLLARNAAELTALASEIDGGGGQSRCFPVDVADEQQVNDCVAQVVREFGRLDVLVNNAGIGVFKPVDLVDAADWDQVMGVNVKGSFLLTKAALPHMKARGQGHVIGVASDLAKRTFATGSLYTASKHAQHAFFDSLRREVRSLGIKVSVLYPGIVDTFFRGGLPGDRAGYLQGTDVADAVAFVLSAPPHVVVDELVLHSMLQEW